MDGSARLKPVAKMADLPPGGSLVVTVDGREVALFNVEGRVCAVTNRCPHRSGPLGKGTVESAADPEAPGSPPALVVRCPIHGWLFELSTGRCLTRPTASVQTYPVACEGEEICLGPPQGQVAGPSAPLPSQ
ncbi:MAG: nitrite reductase (NAD(P)H) small subunit [Candidatus Omnitrophica bacterium]|nr:nitrite reductase (NAD(P)H) small subunit [Candidatus Omnitrophota bacterium]